VEEEKKSDEEFNQSKSIVLNSKILDRRIKRRDALKYNQEERDGEDE
jgi:hypothetical protein